MGTTALEIMREISATTARPEAKPEIAPEEKLTIMKTIEEEIVEEVNGPVVEALKEDPAIETLIEVLEEDDKSTIEVPADGELLATLCKGYRGLNTPELIGGMFQRVLSAKPGNVIEAREAMGDAIEKGNATRFIKKALKKLVDASQIEWDGDMKGAITWL